MRRWVSMACAFGLLILVCAPSMARITRIEITRLESPTFQGVSFGTVGQCEKLVGRAFGDVGLRGRPIEASSTSLARRAMLPAELPTR